MNVDAYTAQLCLIHSARCSMIENDVGICRSFVCCHFSICQRLYEMSMAM